MLKYIAKRLIYIIGCFFLISIIMFGIFKMVPGDPARMALGSSAEQLDPAVYQMMYEQARAKLGLDDPVYVQYFRWIGRMLTGDFGYSSYYRIDVWQKVKAPLLNTAFINIFNLILCFFAATILGIYAALYRGSLFDKIVQVITVIGNSMPTFIVAILVILLFSIKLNLFPVSGMYTADFQGNTLEFMKDRMYYMTLPLMTLFISSLGSLTRYVRTSMLEALSMDCIRTARSKGLKEKAVIYSHAFRNALIPIMTVTAAWFINIFSGSVAIERVFVWNGMGKIMIDALFNQDYNIALAINMFFAVMALVGNLIVDLAYGLADPRIKFQ